MHIGVAYFNTDYAMPIDELAREMEARGFESLFVAEHTHIPTSRRSPFPGGELPKQYWHTLDPFVGLTAAAMVTKKLKVGTGICLIIERDTITTAKSVAKVAPFRSTGRKAAVRARAFSASKSRPARLKRSTARSRCIQPWKASFSLAGSLRTTS